LSLDMINIHVLSEMEKPSLHVLTVYIMSSSYTMNYICYLLRA